MGWEVCLMLLECRLVSETDVVLAVSVPQPRTVRRTSGVEHMWVYRLIPSGISVRGCLKESTQDMGLYFMGGGRFKEK